ncbi:MAG TPA: caspase family protein, partial [Rhodocyclaceae bacterium]|nr:caspase family protein [Rhodocyclaceae bacterium]
MIGNAKYPGMPLRNTVNDAHDMAAALRQVGFEVIEKVDLSQKEMNRVIGQFGSRLGGDTVALFYFAGHGIQAKGKNYLVPVDAEIDTENSVRAETVDVDTVLDQVSASPLNIVILDACR